LHDSLMTASFARLRTTCASSNEWYKLFIVFIQKGAIMPAKKNPTPAKAVSRRAPAKRPSVVAARKQPAAAQSKIAPVVAAKGAVQKLPKLRARPVRDSFTMPESDFALIAALKARALAAKRETKKSELLRAGLHVLMALDSDTLLGTLGRLQPLKVGRPKKSH
jgi:hypothetical protein